MPTVVVPVGFIMGPEFGPDGPRDRDPLHYEVHFGGDPQDLTETEFAVWAAAFVDPPRHAKLEVDRGSLEQHLRTDDGLVGPIADPSPLVSALLDRGLLLEFDPLEEPLRELFRGLGLFPQGQGLGSTPDDPAGYRIGFGGRPVAEVTSNVYQLWSYSLTFPSLWDACVDMAGAAGTGTQPLDVRPEALAREVGAAIPLLVSAGAAFLDPLNHDLR
ncbi:MAG: hypothetical protein J2P24_16610 [Streptosporangiales bacterium]|nr:hypothetical protein [Streptosporangiales bacterium]MBO0889736.1 hypothetical protein [Acidothermales bacterium]